MDRKWWTLIAVCVGTFMLLLDVTIVNVALPSIQKSLDASFSDLQWVVDAYALMLAALLLTTGSLADLFGRRKLFMIGLVIFSLSSLLSGLAQSPLWLNLARGAQGIGGAAMFSTSLALLGTAFQGRERGTAFGAWGAVTGLAVAVGPVVGGALTTGISWRWIFLVNVPIGVAALVLCATKVDESRQSGAPRPDYIGAITFSGALGALVFALIKANSLGWGSAEIIACLVGSVVLLVAFLVAEVVQRERAMFDLKLFRKPTFTGGLIAAFALSASLFALFLYISLYIQDVLGFSALQTGLRFLVLSGVILVVSFVAGRLTTQVPIKLLISPGLLLVGVALLLMRGLTASSGWTHLIPGLPRRRGWHRADQSAARVDRDRGRAAAARRNGLGHQLHVSPGRDRDRDRGPRRDLRAHGHDQRPVAAGSLAAGRRARGARDRDRRRAGQRPRRGAREAPGSGSAGRRPRGASEFRRRSQRRVPGRRGSGVRLRSAHTRADSHPRFRNRRRARGTAGRVAGAAPARRARCQVLDTTRNPNPGISEVWLSHSTFLLDTA